MNNVKTEAVCIIHNRIGLPVAFLEGAIPWWAPDIISSPLSNKPQQLSCEYNIYILFFFNNIQSLQSRCYIHTCFHWDPTARLPHVHKNKGEYEKMVKHSPSWNCAFLLFNWLSLHYIHRWGEDCFLCFLAYYPGAALAAATSMTWTVGIAKHWL